jgi:cell filamentation protein
VKAAHILIGCLRAAEFVQASSRHEGNSRTLRQFFADLARHAGFDLDWSAGGVDEAARRALYHARDAAWMQAKPDALCAIIRAGLKPL